jgi:DNA-binding response OmpR family regulator
VPPDGGARRGRSRTAGAPGPQATPGCRILVIDDEPGLRRLAARVLRPAGFTVALAATGRQGLDIALREPCDVILLDLGLPDLDGEEILRQLRRSRPGQAVLIWSAAGDRQAADRCRSLGARGYMAKPFSVTELIRSVAANCP